MADIAILVAEEYERRMKTSRKLGGGAGAEAAGNTTTTTATVAVRGGVTAALAEKLGEIDWVKKTEEIFKDLEPRSQMGVAAFCGFFSA